MVNLFLTLIKVSIKPFLKDLNEKSFAFNKVKVLSTPPVPGYGTGVLFQPYIEGCSGVPLNGEPLIADNFHIS